MSPLRVALLGSPYVERDGVAVTFDTRKATALLAYLAVTGHPHSRDTLGALLWPELEQAQARGALRRTLSVLNAATGGTTLTADRSSVGLRGESPLALDVTEFRERAGCSSHGHPDDASCPRCLADLSAAAAVYRDDFLAGFALRDSAEFDDWQAFQAHGFRQQLAGVLERLARAHVTAGSPAAAIDPARRWLSLDPLHEPAHAMLMRLYAWTGQRSAAIRQYRECVGVLHRELDVPPLSATTALDEAVRSGALDAPPAAVRAPAVLPEPRAEPAAGLPLVGRSYELALLAADPGPGGRVVVLSGEAGVGKSRLLKELVRGSERSGRRVVTIRCHQGEEGSALGVAAELLRSVLRTDPDAFATLPAAWQTEVRRLVPELAGRRAPQPPPLESAGALARFCAALVATVAAVLAQRRDGAEPGVVIVDDVQWADESSADVLAYLVRRLPDVPLLLALAWRPEAMPADSALSAAVAAGARAGTATTIDLGRLDEPSVAALAAAALSEPPPPAVITRLWQETGGLPLFVTEYLEAFRRGDAAPVDEQWQLPGGVRDLLQSRLAGSSEMTLQVLAAAAVLGSDITPGLVRATSGRGEEEVVVALEEATARAVILETDRDGGRYEFRQDAMRRLVLDSTSLARRRLLHSRAADAIAQRRSRLGEAATVATHLRLAGREAESAEWSWRAAERALRLYAHTEALEHLAAAAALGHPGHLVPQATGDVLTALGRYRDALHAYEQAAAACAPEDRLALATLEHRLAEVHHRLGAWDVADSHLTAALDLVSEEGDPTLRARVLAGAALVAHRRGDADAAAEAGERALEAAAAAGDPAALAQAHDVLGVLASERADYDRAEQHLRESLRHAARLPDAGFRVAALNNLALLENAAGRPEQALVVAREALQLGLEHGDQHRAAALHTNLADLLHAAGQKTEALEHLTAAARLFAGVDDEQLRRPEIWKLARW